MTKVTIITPTYNRSEKLPETIESVLDQTYDRFEYIIVDDGSTDDTHEVIERFGDDRIEYIQLDTNYGANFARNIGIRASDSEYITFIDSDDKWRPDRLERICDLFDEVPTGICGITHSFESTIEGQTVNQFRVRSGRITKQDLASGNPIGGFSNIQVESKLFEQVGLLDEQMPAYQDYEFYLRALDVCDFYGIDDLLCTKTKGAFERSVDRISDNVQRKVRGQELLLSKHGNFITDRARAAFYYSRGRLYMAAGNVSKGQSAFKKAIQIYPYSGLYYYSYVAALCGQRVFKTAQNIKRKVYLFWNTLFS